MYTVSDICNVSLCARRKYFPTKIQDNAFGFDRAKPSSLDCIMEGNAPSFPPALPLMMHAERLPPSKSLQNTRFTQLFVETQWLRLNDCVFLCVPPAHYPPCVIRMIMTSMCCTEWPQNSAAAHQKSFICAVMRQKLKTSLKCWTLTLLIYIAR